MEGRVTDNRDPLRTGVGARGVRSSRSLPPTRGRGPLAGTHLSTRVSGRYDVSESVGGTGKDLWVSRVEGPGTTEPL